jgi:hypothetical protein
MFVLDREGFPVKTGSPALVRGVHSYSRSGRLQSNISET